MIKRASLGLSAAFLVASVSAAFAADFGGSIKDGPYRYEPVSSGPAIYFRLDGGYSTFSDIDVIDDGSLGLVETDIDGTGSIGGGIGMSLWRGFRGDLTYDHRFGADVSGDSEAYGITGAELGDLTSDVFLANLYYDFDFGGRFTPYLGAGIGFSRNKTSSFSIDDGFGTTVDVEGASSTNFAVAAMAGVSMRLTDSAPVRGSFKDVPVHGDGGRGLLLDIGYRFLYLGDAETGAVSDAFGELSPEGPIAEDITAHEFRAGLRYQMN